MGENWWTQSMGNVEGKITKNKIQFSLEKK